MLDWLKRTYLHYHHRRVRQGSDHPTRHARHTRLAFVALMHRVFDRLDGWVSGHGTRPGTHDAVGWAMLAVKA